MCDDECESVSHVLWDCPVYNTLRNDSMCKLQELLGDRFEHFESLDSFEKHLLFWVVSCGRMTLGLRLILLRSIYIVYVWEIRKARL